MPDGPVTILSLCAGEGRDALPVLAEHPRRDDVVARLVEFDPVIADSARTAAAEAGLSRVEVVTGDAALSRFLVELLDDDRTLWKQLLDNPGLLRSAVDELLRYTGLSNTTLLRLAVEDVELPGGTVKAGQAVAITGNCAMRDPEAYPDPDTVIFDRDAPPTLIFGGGPHYCLGAHLAKAELIIGLGTLLRRLPRLRVTATRDELTFSGGEIVDSIITLPAAW